jgi:hypothetical protein
VTAVLDIHVQEHRTRWTSPQPIEDVLAMLDAAPWGRLAEMSVDLRARWIPFDRARAIAEVWDHTGVNLRWSPGVEASIAHNPVNNTVGLYLPRPAFAAVGSRPVLELVEQLAGALPAFAWAKAVATGGATGPAATALLGAPPVPPPFDARAWLHVIHPRGRAAMMIDRGALLVAPVRVDERADGTIWMRTYDEPFAIDARETVGKVRLFARHLGRFAWPRAASSGPAPAAAFGGRLR